MSAVTLETATSEVRIFQTPALHINIAVLAVITDTKINTTTLLRVGLLLWTLAGTDRQDDVLLHRPCSTYCAGCAIVPINQGV